MLRPIADDIWVYDGSVQMPVGPLHARATVVRRRDRALVIHSPLAFDDLTVAQIDALGEVRALVAPSRLHSMFLRAASARWPRASVLAAPGLAAKLTDLPFTPLPRTGTAPELGDDLLVRRIEGVPFIDEHVFLHPPSRTLIVTDLVFNVHAAQTFGMKAFLWIGGAWKRTAQDYFWRLLRRDRAAAAASVADILAWDFERVLVAHGDIIEGDAHARLARALAWLGAARR